MPATKLGRWQLHYDPHIVNSKVDVPRLGKGSENRRFSE